MKNDVVTIRLHRAIGHPGYDVFILKYSFGDRGQVETSIGKVEWEKMPDHLHYPFQSLRLSPDDAKTFLEGLEMSGIRDLEAKQMRIEGNAKDKHIDSLQGVTDKLLRIVENSLPEPTRY